MNSKSIVYITLLLTFLCCVNSQDINTSISVNDLMTYNKWRMSNKRTYLNEDEQIFRQVIFFENLKLINEHNKNPQNTYTTGINQFSDMTQEEFASKILNDKLSEQQGFQSSHTELKFSSSFSQSPSVDWRTKGAISNIKQQGICGSCWTFSSVALMESVNFIKNGKTVDFSEQQLLDCVTRQNGFNSYGCGGGIPDQALAYASKFGMVEESKYPYVGSQQKCKVSEITNGFKPKTVTRVRQNSSDLKNALNQSPVAVVVDASKWNSYKSGIFNDCSTCITHAVLAVGYDVQGNWLIKNSWGTGWGENGYIRLSGSCNPPQNGLIITA